MAVIVNERISCPHTATLWSGNFLNWATMSRLDVVRKMLYGGKRHIDGVPGNDGSNSVTVLERANLSQDSHSYVKVYYGTDIRDFTPFTPEALTRWNGTNPGIYAGLTICNRSTQQSSGGQPVMRLARGNFKMWALVTGKVCSWREERYQWFDYKAPRYFVDPDKGNGPIAHELESPHDGSVEAWQTGYARYNSNDTDKDEGGSEVAIGPDLIVRVRVCNPNLLGEERCQPHPVSAINNYKPYGLFQEFGTQSSQSAAIRAEFGVIMGSYDKNVTAGALRKNVEDFTNEINPNTGVFCHSSAAACSTGTPGVTYTTGAIQAFDNIQLVGREGETDALEEEDGIDTDYRLAAHLQNGVTAPMMADGVLPAWGNPLGEMFTQGLRYFAGGSSTNPSNTSMDAKYKMPVAAWKDPFRIDADRAQKFGPPACRPMYIMALSSSALSFDESSAAVFNQLPNREAPLKSYVDWIGSNEKIVGPQHGWRSVGAVDGGFGQDCTLKNLTNLSDATGVCPEYGGFKGTWQISGASLYGNTAKIRDVNALRSQNQLPSDLNRTEDALKVKTLAASLQGGVPRIEVPIPNTTPQRYVYITPESVWEGNKNLSGAQQDAMWAIYDDPDKSYPQKMTEMAPYRELFPGALLSFFSISAGERYGAFMVSWNDRPFGGDYDMDLTGFLRYDIVDDGLGGYSLKITTDVLQMTSGMTGTHGYSVMGTDRDGRYLTHTHGHIASDAIRNVSGNLCKSEYFTAADRDEWYRHWGANGKPHRCNSSWAAFEAFDVDLLHTETFKMVGANDVIIQDPLWYSAKYGFTKSSTANDDGTFTDLNASELMQKIAADPTSWDKVLGDGTPGSDQTPDGYVLARRPELLEAQLRKMLEALATTSNAAAALSSSTLADGVYKYAVQFDNQQINGKLEAYQLNNQGIFSSRPVWEAGQKLQAAAALDQGNSRAIITNNGGTGVAFRWNQLSPTWITQLTTQSTNRLSEANAQAAVSYIRGDQRDEGPRGLRERGTNLLGPIINSTPWVQQRPMANWGPIDGYADFYQQHLQRPRLLWVGANDGMLHAFNATTGAEVMAYVPGALANRMAEIPLQRNTITRLGTQNFVTGTEVRPAGSVWPYVDGNPFTADVKVGDNWHTYAFGSLGRGGRGIFALDATDVGQLRESRAAQIFKWQFTAADDVDLGYQVGDTRVQMSTNQAAPIARMNNGKFAWILGNGQHSRDGKAVLFIVYVDGPNSAGSWSQRYEKIVVDAGSGNGLSNPRWEDLDGDGTADVVYAGDIKGHLWKFDISKQDSTQWGPAFSGPATAQQPLAVPLFQATRQVGNQVVGQPITVAPELVYMGLGGVVVNIATGNGFRQGDFGATAGRQSMYGVWDRGQAMLAPKLLARVFTRLPNGAVVPSNNDSMVWGGTSNYDGWRVDLPELGEAVLTDPSLDAGVLSFVSTRSRAGQMLCNTAPQNSLYMLDPISGKPERVTQGNETVDQMEFVVAARDIDDPKVRIVSDRRPPAKVACTAGEPGCTCTGADCTKSAPRCGPGQRVLSAQARGTDAFICYDVAPRMHWREIPGLRTYPDS